MSVHLRTRKRGKVTSYYLDYYTNGIRRTEGLGLHLTGSPTDAYVKREAERLHAEAMLREGKPTARVRLSDFMRHVARRKAIEPGTKRSQESTAKVVDRLAPDIELWQIDSAWLQHWQELLLSNYGRNTAAVYYRFTASVLQRATVEKLIDHNPARDIKGIGRKPSKISALTLEEVRLLQQTPCSDSECKRAFLFACFTGLRFSDVKQLSTKHVFEDHIEMLMQKPQIMLYLPLHPNAKSLLGEPRDNGLYFDLPTSQGCRYHIVQWGKQARLNKHLHFHMSRHTFATLMLEHTKDLYMVSKLLGHQSIKETERYAKVVDERKKQAVLSLPGL